METPHRQPPFLSSDIHRWLLGSYSVKKADPQQCVFQYWTGPTPQKLPIQQVRQNMMRDSMTVASLPFVQNTFNYTPVDAERCILDKLDIPSKFGSVNTTAGSDSYYLERPVAAEHIIRLTATPCLTPICRPRNLDAEHQESSRYWAPPQQHEQGGRFPPQEVVAACHLHHDRIEGCLKGGCSQPPDENGCSSSVFTNSSPSHDSLSDEYPCHLAATDKQQFLAIPLWHSYGPRQGPSTLPTLVQSHTFIVTLSI